MSAHCQDLEVDSESEKGEFRGKSRSRSPVSGCADHTRYPEIRSTDVGAGLRVGVVTGTRDQVLSIELHKTL